MPVSTSVQFQKVEKKEYEPIKANIYQVQISDIREKYKAPWGSPQGSEQTELYLTFEFLILNQGEYFGRKLWKDVRPVAPVPSEDAKFKPSWLWRIISAVIGHPLSFSEGVNWGVQDTNNLIGRQLRLIVNQTPKNAQGKSYNNITDVLPIEAEIDPLLADNRVSEGFEAMPTEEEPLPDEPDIDSIPFE